MFVISTPSKVDQVNTKGLFTDHLSLGAPKIERIIYH